MSVDLKKDPIPRPSHLSEAKRWAEESANFYKKAAEYADLLQFDKSDMAAKHAAACLNMAADHFALHRHSISLQDIEK